MHLTESQFPLPTLRIDPICRLCGRTHSTIIRGSLRIPILLNDEDKESNDGDQNGD